MYPAPPSWSAVQSLSIESFTTPQLLFTKPAPPLFPAVHPVKLVENTPNSMPAGRDGISVTFEYKYIPPPSTSACS